MTINTAAGPVTVLHRLVLGVECIDATTDRPVTSQVRVGWEAPLRSHLRRADRKWPCVDLEAAGTARFKLRSRPPLPTTIVLRVDDPARRYVPRRFALQLWTPAELDETVSPPYVPVGSRVLRAWLWPGSASPVPRGTTAIRGRVAHLGNPVRWARVTAIGPTNGIAGRAHADDRGEFVLAITDPAQNPLQAQVSVDVVVEAPKVPDPVDPVDRCRDLRAEDVPRSQVPPSATDLDNAVLRGFAQPPGYVANANVPTTVVVPIGAELSLSAPIDFVPTP